MPSLVTCFAIIAAVTSTAKGFFDLEDGYWLLKQFVKGNDITKLPPNVHIRWIDQPTDHFDAKRRNLWAMRYYERVDMFRPGGPMIFFLGGESEAHPWFLTTGLAYELANETNGALYMTEHRYYGSSNPNKNNGAENLKYLSSRQALADIAKVIRTLSQLPQYRNSKTVLIGGSYPGNLAAWMRLKYPELVDAALASSAPVLAKENFYEYLETVSDNYRTHGGKNCHDAIEETFKNYNEMFKTPEGIQRLKTEQNICKSSNMSKPENQHYFIYDKVGYFMGNSQYGSVEKVQSHCQNLTSSRGGISKEHSLADFVSRRRSNGTYDDADGDCVDIDFDALVNDIKAGGDWLASWVFQKCTEFSYAKSTSSDKQPFSKNIPMETFYKLCVDSFGKGFNQSYIKEAVNQTNNFYGGLAPNVTKVVFTNGDMDPWHRLGILKDLSDEAPAILIPKSSHCRDLLPNREGDLEELVAARTRVKSLLKKWISKDQ